MKKESVILGFGMLTLGCLIGLGIGFFVGVGGTLFRTKNLIDEVTANHPSNTKLADNTMRMKAVSKQFSWHFHYHGADGDFGITDTRLISNKNPLGLDFENDEAARDDIHTTELVLPSDTTAFFMLTSADVIHGFSGLGGWEQDIIPGTELPLPITTNSTEERGQIKCSQLCEKTTKITLPSFELSLNRNLKSGSRIKNRLATQFKYRKSIEEKTAC